MDPLTRRPEKLIDRRSALMGLGFAALAPLGCFGTGKNLISKQQPEPALAPAQGRIVVSWDKHVKYADDQSKGGAVYPCLLGRIYLFGPDQAVPYIGDGDLQIDLYDSTPHGPGSEPQMTDMFCIGPEVLKKFARADNVFGQGYTVLFPWFHYRRDVAQVYITTRYRSLEAIQAAAVPGSPPKGEQLFDQSTFSINHSATEELEKKGMGYVLKEISLKQ
jgi:hypothetical protein